MTIIAHAQQLLDIENVFGTSAIFSRHKNFNCKHLTQVEVGYGL